MALALSPHLPPGLLSHLVVADMTPAKGSLSPEFRGYVKGMKKVEAEAVSSRKEAHHILTEFEQVRSQTYVSTAVRDLTNRKGRILASEIFFLPT
jgi:hypothetical protein